MANKWDYIRPLEDKDEAEKRAFKHSFESFSTLRKMLLLHAEAEIRERDTRRMLERAMEIKKEREERARRV